MVTFIMILILWSISIFLNIFFIKIIDGKKMNLNEMMEKEGIWFMIMTVIAPIAALILGIGVIYKLSIDYVNPLPDGKKKKAPVKDCKKCVNRKDNECGVYKMTLRPDMMCKGNFYNKSKMVASN